jgi:uncharacterized phage protein (TIGR02218 family)
MKTVDSSLNDYLNSIIDAGGVDEMMYCELFTLTATNGDVLRFTDFDGDVTIGGNTYSGTGNIVPERGPTKTSVGFDVDEMTLDFLIGEDESANIPIVLNGLTLQQLVTCRFLDKAEVLVTRLFWGGTPGLIPPWAPVHKFGGTIAKATENTRTKVAFDVQSHMQKLQRQIPQTVMQPSCGYSHYGDERCGVSMAAFQVACVIAGGGSSVLLKAAALGVHQPDEYFDKGFVIFTSGQNKGLAQAVKQSTQADGLILVAPMIFTPQIGDTFYAVPGCDLTQGAGGCAKFSNLARYGGYPFVPAPEAAI